MKRQESVLSAVLFEAAGLNSKSNVQMVFRYKEMGAYPLYLPLRLPRDFWDKFFLNPPLSIDKGTEICEIYLHVDKIN